MAHLPDGGLLNDEGAINVFEAVLAALLIVGALFYWNVLQQPDFEDPGAGAQMDGLAEGVLDVLVADSIGGHADLGAWATARLAGTDDGSSAVAEMDTLLPDGVAWSLRLNTGAGSIHLAPPGEGDRSPRAGGSAVTYVVVSPQYTGSSFVLYPGQPFEATEVLLGLPLEFCNVGTVIDPHDRQVPVDPERRSGADWQTIWNDAEDAVPLGLPYGQWRLPIQQVPILCPNPPPTVTFSVMPPDGQGGALDVASDIVYALELVVWPGG